MRLKAPMDLLDPKLWHGTRYFGFNATGVIETTLHVDSDQIVLCESMPAPYVQQCMDEVQRLSAAAKRHRPGGMVKGRIPMTLWRAWRREWEQGPKLHGMLWRAFFNSKFMDRDYSKFRV